MLIKIINCEMQRVPMSNIEIGLIGNVDNRLGYYTFMSQLLNAIPFKWYLFFLVPVNPAIVSNASR